MNDNPENVGSLSCADITIWEKSLSKVSKVSLKALKMGIQSIFT